MHTYIHMIIHSHSPQTRLFLSETARRHPLVSPQGQQRARCKVQMSLWNYMNKQGNEWLRRLHSVIPTHIWILWSFSLLCPDNALFVWLLNKKYFSSHTFRHWSSVKNCVKISSCIVKQISCHLVSWVYRHTPSNYSHAHWLTTLIKVWKRSFKIFKE